MIDYVPDDLKYLPEAAMNVWFEEGKSEFPKEDLERLRVFLITEIHKND